MRNDKILLVDDEQGILDILEMLLIKEGFSEIKKANTGTEALSYVRQIQFDLIVLDVSLPDMDGFQLCSQIRQHTQAPILFVTARSSDLDKLTGFGIGGDDYITKPFHPLELMARIKAQFRRQKIYQEMTSPQSTVFDFGFLVIYQDEGRVCLHNKEVPLTAKEFELLTFLCSHPNRIFTTRHLYAKVWDDEYLADDKTVVMHISKLRRKIEANPKQPQMIVNLRGLGYKFIPPKEVKQ